MKNRILRKGNETRSTSQTHYTGNRHKQIDIRKRQKSSKTQSLKCMRIKSLHVHIQYLSTRLRFPPFYACKFKSNLSFRDKILRNATSLQVSTYNNLISTPYHYRIRQCEIIASHDHSVKAYCKTAVLTFH